VQARKELAPGQRLTLQKIKDVFQSDRWENTTPDDVMVALNSGQERLAVWTLNCIGYDRAFQLELCDKFPLWVSPPPKKKKAKKPKKSTKKGTKKESTTPVKGRRKQVESDSEIASRRSARLNMTQRMTIPQAFAALIRIWVL